jgi:L-fucose mutarotase
VLKSQLLHPEILSALARAGHGSKILIADGNYPASTTLGPNARLVHLNLAPGKMTATEVLAALVTAIPVEQASVMDSLKSGPNASKEDPEIWSEFRKLLTTSGISELTKIERIAFYEASRQPDVALVIQTGEQRIYGNLLLTIGVVK